MVLGQRPNEHPGDYAVGASRFFRVTNNVNPQNFDLGGGLLVFSGYFRSVRCTTNRLMLNVNVASSAFYRDGNLTELIHEWSCAYHGLRGGQQVNLPVLQQGDLHALDRFLKGLRVMTHYLGRPVGRTICGLASTDSNPVPKHVTFKIKEDGKPEKVKSVSQYFKDSKLLMTPYLYGTDANRVQHKPHRQASDPSGGKCSDR